MSFLKGEHLPRPALDNHWSELIIASGSPRVYLEVGLALTHHPPVALNGFIKRIGVPLISLSSPFHADW